MTSSLAEFPPGYAEEDISSRVLIAASLFIILEIGVVTLRCVARLKFDAKLGVDDYLMAPALLLCLGICAIGISKYSQGLCHRSLHTTHCFLCPKNTEAHLFESSTWQLTCVTVA